ncbi:MAG: D-alanine--D-alanine ligase [Candidatus Cloacimonetes bacterium]|nr:D-alanine--D-alanine ligase [Candidatus Cloacimonadota bacterium]
MNYRILILSGGNSNERDVSLTSAAQIAESLQDLAQEIIVIDPAAFCSYQEMMREIIAHHPDIVFNGLHGAEGEDGRIQALLSLEKIPYTGSGYRASVLAMDKYLSGMIAQSVGVPAPQKILLRTPDVGRVEIFSGMVGFPFIIKPNDGGSSVGISLVQDASGIEPALISAFEQASSVVAEQFIHGRELTVTILDGTPLPVVEITPRAGWYDYTNKYTQGNTRYDVPAALGKEETKRVQQLALQVYQVLGCEVYSRIDFRYDGKEFYFLEVNTLPGMTPLSLTPMAAKAHGLSFQKLLMEIIRLSLNKQT